MQLTKSDFLLFLEAPRHLWAEKHGYIDKIPSDFEINIMKQGYEVENLAKEYLEKSILKPKENERLIFQETFTDKQFTARADILVYKPAADSYDLYEVKSGTRFKKENFYDVTYQFLIISKQIKIDRVFILHLNKEYVRYSSLNLEELFVAEDVTEKVDQFKEEVNIQREIALDVAFSSSPENIEPCYNPKYCPCPNICHPNIPEYSIYDIPRLSKKKKNRLLEQGILDIKDVPDSFPLSAKQRSIVTAAQSKEEIVNREAIKREIECFVAPYYFLDYETYLAAIPMFDGYKPQQQMVFQYSLHKMESLNGEIYHTEY